MNEDLRYQIALSLVPNVGPVHARQLVNHFGSPEAVFAERPEVLRKLPNCGESLAQAVLSEESLRRADNEIAFISKYGIKTHFFTDASYPFRLKQCADAPIMLYSKGTDDFNSGRFLAIVGTRKLTANGKEICQKLVKDLAETQSNLTIVSGMAYGADICAHKAALDAGLPTFGVVAHGLDRIYPTMHTAVAHKMIESGGAIITEYLPKTEPLASNFVARNRIVAGMCDAVLVVESALKGGSLITAELANGYSRDVFAVPGRPTDVQSQGCNDLIYNNKAVLIQSAADLEKFMMWEPSGVTREQQQQLFESLTTDEQNIIDHLRGNDAVHVNSLAVSCGIPLQKLLAMLMQLEFKGLIVSLPGSQYKIKN